MDPTNPLGDGATEAARWSESVRRAGALLRDHMLASLENREEVSSPGSVPRRDEVREGLLRAGAEAAARMVYQGLSWHGGGEFLVPLRDWVESALPKGRVTFLLGDVVGSTRMWDRHPEATARAMERRDEIVTDVVERCLGLLPREQGEGDSFVAVFERAADAVRAALELQVAFAREPWPEGAEVRVRMGLHTGEAQLRSGNYYGLEVNRCARIRSLAHGGQVLMSGVCAEEVGEDLPQGASLISRGEQHLKDLSRPEEIHELAHPGLVQDRERFRAIPA
jgi:class 3 adenylate cyclase